MVKRRTILKVLIALVFILLVIISWEAYPYLQLNHFQRSRAVSKSDSLQYYTDKKILSDTIISWTGFTFSPTAFKLKDWWIDTMLYNPDKTKLLAIANVISDPSGEMPFSNSQWILGLKQNENWFFLSSSASQQMILFDINTSKVKLSEGSRRELLVFLYYPLTFIQRNNFWKKLFAEEERIITIQKDELNKWRNSQKEIDVQP